MTLTPTIKNEIQQSSGFGKFLTLALVAGSILYCINYTATFTPPVQTAVKVLAPIPVKASTELTLEDKKKIVSSLSDDELLAILTK